MNKIMFIVFVLFLIGGFSIVDAASTAICRVPSYEGICCSTILSDYVWPSGNGICCGGMPFYGDVFCPWIDFDAPLITVVSPLNSSYVDSFMWFNVTLDETGDWCGYSLDGESNVSIVGFGMIWNTQVLVPDGQHNVSFSCNDTSGNMNTTDNIYFIVDTTPPQVSVVPVGVVPSHSNVTFDVTCFDETTACNVTTINVGSYFCSINHTIESSCEISLIPECEFTNYDYFLNSTDILGNFNDTINGTMNVKNNDGCACVVSNDCFSSACIGASFCGISTPPILSFLDIDAIMQISLGDIRTMYLKLSNPHSIAETVELNIYGDPTIISYWTYFQDQKYGNRTHKIVSLNPGEEIYVPVNIFGAKSGKYNIIIIGTSLSNGLKTRKELPVLVYYQTNEGLNSQTPGLGVFGLLMIVLFASFIGKERL
ncbi:hypothetical protein GQ473_06395 [archaeon]|nr:hypothetical protein [archaeon]